MDHLVADIAIVGGGVGGCAAALAALEAGCRVVLTEETDWLGGQLTSQLTPPDEHGWIERLGRTRAYQCFREEVRSHYRRHTPLTDEARRHPCLNPGNGWVSPLCHEPRVALTVLEHMLGPYVRRGQLLLLLEHAPVDTRLDGGDRLATVVVCEVRTGIARELAAPFILDATELGDLLALAGAEHVTGQESQVQTGEPSAPAAARPGNMQAFSWCFAMDHREGENHVGTAPPGYDFWRKFRPALSPPWPGPWLGWGGLNPRTMEPVRYRFSPHQERMESMGGLWSYRRIIDRSLFAPGAFASDIVVVNWPMIDYLPGSLIGGSAANQTQAREAARQLSLSVLHWLQTEAPRPDGGAGWPGLRLRPDTAGTLDGLAKAPYIRESRRLRAEFTIREPDLSARCRPGERLGERYEDTVGIGCYRIDLHPTCGGDNYIDVPSLPFRIPLGALIPVRLENLLPAAKNLGTTHITNGGYRVHPVEWNIGEVAGALAAFCLHTKQTPRQVWRKSEWRMAFQDTLAQRGVELRWPEDLNLEDGDSHAHAQRAAR
ncbi:MAG: FAD-dependent oxidoreductase [Verrucomicrobia bacterium]|nr:FAD-dependent oxidoreductase [Verrucomicrobiota bacterium]